MLTRLQHGGWRDKPRRDLRRRVGAARPTEFAVLRPTGQRRPYHPTVIAKMLGVVALAFGFALLI
jgi:hypothetical protein